jgi:hypothetical protein
MGTPRRGCSGQERPLPGAGTRERQRGGVVGEMRGCQPQSPRSGHPRDSVSKNELSVGPPVCSVHRPGALAHAPEMGRGPQRGVSAAACRCSRHLTASNRSGTALTSGSRQVHCRSSARNNHRSRYPLGHCPVLGTGKGSARTCPVRTATIRATAARSSSAMIASKTTNGRERVIASSRTPYHATCGETFGDGSVPPHSPCTNPAASDRPTRTLRHRVSCHDR